MRERVILEESPRDQPDGGAAGGPGRVPFPIPEKSKVPAPAQSTRADYDLYFGLVRNNPDLARWSAACLSVIRAQRSGMQESELAEVDKLRIMDGMVTVLQVIVEKWLEVALATDERG